MMSESNSKLQKLKKMQITNDTSSGNYHNPVATVALAVIIYLFSQAMAVLMIGVVFLSLGISADEAEVWVTKNTVGTFVLYVVVSLSMFTVLRLIIKKRNISWKDLGFREFELNHIGLALLAYLVYLVGLFVTVIIVNGLIPGLDTTQEQQLGFGSEVQGYGLVLVFASLVVLPPLIEETLMRGFVFTSLRNKLQFIPSLIITGLLFAVGHLQFGSGAKLLWIAALDTFILSGFLCYLREKYNSIWPCILLHGIKNFVAFFVLFVLKS